MSATRSLSANRSDRLYGVLAGAMKTPSINLTRFRKLGIGGMYSASLASPVLASRNYSLADYNAALEKLTDGAFSVVAGTLYESHSSNPQQIRHRAIIEANVKSMTEAEAVEAKFTAVTANVFKDTGDNMWQLIGEGDNKRLVQTNAGEFDDILAEHVHRGRVTASFASQDVMPYEDGDYCMFMSKAGTIDFGIVNCSAKDDVIFSRSTGKEETIVPEQVVEAAAFDLQNKIGKKTFVAPATWRKTRVLAGTFSGKAYLDYMRSMFAGTEFFQKLESIMRERGIA